jgi:hypothetical protein
LLPQPDPGAAAILGDELDAGDDREGDDEREQPDHY